MTVCDMDATLAQLLVDHDPVAFEYLYQYGRLLEVILWRRFGTGIPEEDRKDIVADTLMHAWQAGHRFDPQLSSLKSWLVMLLLYQAQTFLRRHLVMITGSLDEIVEDIHVPEQVATPLDQHPSEHMQHLLHALPPRRARICKMFYYEGQSVSEIAMLLQISNEAVRSHLHHARADLRRGLEQK